MRHGVHRVHGKPAKSKTPGPTKAVQSRQSTRWSTEPRARNRQTLVVGTSKQPSHSRDLREPI